MSQTATLDMTKGAKLDVTKTNPGLALLCFGLGWDANAGNGPAYDLDAFAILLNKDKKLVGGAPELANSICYFKNLNLKGVAHSGDNLTGAGDGDDEIITIDLAQLKSNPDVDSVLFCVNIYEAKARGNQNFGSVKNAFIRAWDKTTSEQILKFDLQEEGSSYNAYIFGRFYNHNGEWKFEAVGEGKNGSLQEIAQTYL